MINCIAMLLWLTHIIIITPDLYYDQLHCNGFKLTNAPICAFSYISPLYSGVPVFSPLDWPAVQVHFTFVSKYYTSFTFLGTGSTQTFVQSSTGHRTREKAAALGSDRSYQSGSPSDEDELSVKL